MIERSLYEHKFYSKQAPHDLKEMNAPVLLGYKECAMYLCVPNVYTRIRQTYLVSSYDIFP